MPREIFVFGSNLAGIHGKGAALHAVKNYGAVYGQGYGRQGASFAIPTKDEDLKVLSLDAIWIGIRCVFVPYVIYHLDDSMKLQYNVTPIGCGLAGYKPEQIAPLFKWAGDFPTVKLPKEFLEVLNG